MKSTLNFDITIEPNSKEHYSFLSYEFSPWFTESRFLLDSKIQTVVARNSEKILAVSTFQIKCKEILNLYTLVLPSYRKMGINKKIKSFIENLPEAIEKNLLVSHVRYNNSASLKSLRDSGYQEDKTFNGTYFDGCKKLRMFKQLRNN